MILLLLTGLYHYTYRGKTIKQHKHPHGGARGRNAGSSQRQTVAQFQVSQRLNTGNLSSAQGRGIASASLAYANGSISRKEYKAVVDANRPAGTRVKRAPLGRSGQRYSSEGRRVKR